MITTPSCRWISVRWIQTNFLLCPMRGSQKQHGGSQASRQGGRRRLPFWLIEVCAKTSGTLSGNLRRTTLRPQGPPVQRELATGKLEPQGAWTYTLKGEKKIWPCRSNKKHSLGGKKHIRKSKRGLRTSTGLKETEPREILMEGIGGISDLTTTGTKLPRSDKNRLTRK